MTRTARSRLYARRTGWLSRALVEAALDAVLAAHRVGTLAALCRQHPRLVRGLLRRSAAPSLWFLRSTEAAELAWVVETFVGWLVGQARPDGLDAAQPIPRHAWLGSAAWRGLLAVAAHSGLAAVPRFPERYRARDGEPAFEHLCGLWEVAPSSFYRYVERGREQLIAVALQLPADSAALPALCDHFQQATFCRESANDASAQRARLQVAMATALESRAYEAALWYAARSGIVDVVSLVIERGCNELAAGPVVDPLLKRFEPVGASDAALVRLKLAYVALARVRGQTEQERQHLDDALRIASRSKDAVLLGDVYGAQGRHVEPRDVDRAIADYRVSVEHYDSVVASGESGAERMSGARLGLLTSLVWLAFLYSRRGDPRCKAVLERANEVRALCDAPLDLQAMIESAWGEQRQRERDVPAAIEAFLRALLLYERSGNRRQVLRAQASLVVLYAVVGQTLKAQEYAQRVFAFAERGVVEPQVLSATQLNLGIAYYRDGRHDEAMHHYQQALAVATQASLKTLMGQAHFNLAELFYKRFQMHGQAQDEQHGDTHVGLAKAIWALGGDKAAGEATSNLKRTMLGQQEQLIYERMLPGELAAHFDEMSEIQTQRLRLGVPTSDADEHIRAHLRIAQAYTRIAVKEREAAVALIQKNDRGEHYAAELRQLKSTFERALTQESVIAARWQAQAGCPIVPEQIETVVRQGLHDGGLTKSSYGALCKVSPATASKHLSTLTQLGLVQQVSRGPATRYLIVQPA
jgi:tetratricopeptide (TPR) repeat protein